MRKIAVLLALLSVGLLFWQFVSLTSAEKPTDELRFAQKVNLALRRTAHYLLAEQGDTTSRILPVRQLNATTFLVRLEKPFDYGALPAVLHQSMAVHDIGQNYDVAVLNCTDGELMLGYNFRDFLDNKEAPCAGRQQDKGCYNLQVSFNSPAQAGLPIRNWLGWLVGFLLLGGSYVVWNKGSMPEITQSGLEPASSRQSDQIDLGQLSFSMANQSVRVAGVTHSLTYREAKLLNLFVRHPNQLLERDFILKSVWEDEGIIVGRSVDVFVSRLRKLLQPDPGIRLVAVHGVGYRLEIRQKADSATS